MVNLTELFRRTYLNANSVPDYEITAGAHDTLPETSWDSK